MSLFRRFTKPFVLSILIVSWLFASLAADERREEIISVGAIPQPKGLAITEKTDLSAALALVSKWESCENLWLATFKIEVADLEVLRDHPSIRDFKWGLMPDKPSAEEEVVPAGAMAIIKSFPKLESMRLFGKVTPEDFRMLCEIETLKVLMLTPVGAGKLPTFCSIGNLQRLRNLSLSENMLNDSHIECLEKLENLTALWIDKNPEITDRSIKHLVQLKSLKLFVFTDTGITRDGSRLLKSELRDDALIFGTPDDLEEFREELKTLPQDLANPERDHESNPFEPKI